MELGRVEKYQEREGARVVGENAAEERVSEVNSTGIGGGSERLELRERISGRMVGGYEGENERDDEETEESRRHFGI